MKKIIFILVALFSFVFSSCDKNSKNVFIEDGKGRKHKIEVMCYPCKWEDYGFTNKEILTEFIQEIFDNVKRRSESPYTFIPKSFSILDVKDTINITFNDNTTITLYSFTCGVRGLAKSKYNVDTEVSELIGWPLFSKNYAREQFFMKDNIKGYSHCGIYGNPRYEIFDHFVLNSENEEELLNQEIIETHKNGTIEKKRYFKCDDEMYEICIFE